MRSTKSIILIVIALACGLIASIGISSMIDRPEGSDEPTTETIYVAASNIPSWSQLKPELVREEEWPIGKVPQDAVRSVEEFEGKSPRYPLYPGEPIVLSKLTDESGGQASVRIPAGHQVFAIAVEIENALAGLVSPGDKVDVLCYIGSSNNSFTSRKGGDHRLATGTRTILRNVTVFAVNDQIERQGEEESLEAKTVSLLVKPKESEKLLLAKELGTIHLALRKPGDDTEIETGGATPSDLDGDSSEGTDGLEGETTDDEDSGTGGIFDILTMMQEANSTDVDGSNATESEDTPSFSTVIMSPDEVLGTYTFTGKAEDGKLAPLPAELLGGGDEDDASERDAESEPEGSSQDEGAEEEFGEEDDVEWESDEEIDIDPSSLGL